MDALRSVAMAGEEEGLQQSNGINSIIDADPRRIKRVRLRLRTSVKAAE